PQRGTLGHQGADVARRSARRRPQAARAEGHGPGARRLEPLAHLGRRWQDLRRQAARFRPEGEPQDVPWRHPRHARGTGAHRAPAGHRQPGARGPEDQAARRPPQGVVAGLGADRGRGAGREAVRGRAQPAARRGHRGAGPEPAVARRLRQGADDGRRGEADRGAPAMNREQLMSVLIAPHVTEKTSLAMQNHNQYTFRVRRDATKTDVRKAVELMFDVKVAGVQVVNEPGKTRRFGKTVGRTQDWKKAYVSLQSGQTIDYEARAKACGRSDMALIKY